MKLDRPLVVFDLETTGLFPKKDRIIELGAIKVSPDGTEEERCWLLNPSIPIPPESTAVHGIADEDVKDCPTFAERADEIFAFFEGCDLSGFNSDRYDIPCLEEEFARVGMNFAVSQRRCIDVQRIYHRMEPRDLTAAVRFYLGRDHAGAHGAEADTRATLEVLKARYVVAVGVEAGEVAPLEEGEYLVSALRESRTVLHVLVRDAVHRRRLRRNGDGRIEQPAALLFGAVWRHLYRAELDDAVLLREQPRRLKVEDDERPV